MRLDEFRLGCDGSSASEGADCRPCKQGEALVLTDEDLQRSEDVNGGANLGHWGGVKPGQFVHGGRPLAKRAFR